jgi:hypothetical protein
MGPCCPVPLRLLALAIALGQRALLGIQQPNPSPAGPTPAGNDVTTAQAAPAESADFRTQSLSHLHLQRGDRTFDIYLFAPDQSVDVLSASYCAGDAGARQYSGHFQLISVDNKAVVSRLDLDPDFTFVEKKPHDGARLVRDPKSGQDLVAIYQYGSCTSESVQFFSADPSGDLFAIPFLDQDGRSWNQMLTGSDGAMPPRPDGALMFCSYASDPGYDFCETYAFDGANFREAAKWMTKEAAAPIKGLNDEGQAARVLFDFLSLMAEQKYPSAAHYHKTIAELARQETFKPGQKSAYLDKYCNVMRGQCLMPMTVERKASPGGPVGAPMLFQVSFQTSDFKPFKIGANSTFDFRVAKTAGGFKVLDLPPRVP